MRHQAIHNLYPQVVSVDDDAGAFDAEGNQVTVNEDAVAAEIERLIPMEQAKHAEASRKAAYIAEADPLFFKWQAGEGTQEEWQAKREEIRQRYPK